MTIIMTLPITSWASCYIGTLVMVLETRRFLVLGPDGNMKSIAIMAMRSGWP